MSEDYFTADMGSIWVQPDGPNTKPQYLGCHDMGDISEPGGDITKRYCPDPAGHGRWNVALTSQGIPGDVTASITTFVGSTQDYLQGLANQSAKCPFPIYVHQSTCGRKDTFLAYEAGTLLQGCRIASRGKTNLAMREGAEASEMTFELSADNPFTEYWPLRMSKLTTTEAQDFMDITLCGEDRCTGPCGDEEERGDEFMATSEATTLGEVVLSEDGGATNTIVAGPAAWLIGENISAVVCYSTGRDTVRHIIANGTVAGNAEVAYSDNGGTAWTVAVVGAVATEFFPWNGSLFALDAYHIWGCTDTGGGAAGNIYFSEDSGVTWALQGTGADVLNVVHFQNETTGICVGDTNTIMSTTDGGNSWSTHTGPAGGANAKAAHCFDRYRWQVGFDDGELWGTFDGGETWTQRDVPVPPTGTSVDRINSLHYIDDHNGVMAVKFTVAGPTYWGAIYRTFDGGYSWEIYVTDAAYDTGTIGMASAVMATPNLAYGVGDLENALGTIYKLSL